MSSSVPAAPTVGEIARRLGEPVHRIEYVIRARQIQPVSTAGNSRVFSDAQVDRIASELRRIDQERATDSLADLVLSPDACELCGQYPQEHYIDQGQWAGKHCCTSCWESLPEQQQEEEGNSK